MVWKIIYLTVVQYILLNSEIREACSLLLQEMPFGIKQVLPLKGK